MIKEDYIYKKRRSVLLEEKTDVRQIEGEGFRRWFTDRYFDLIVWYADKNEEKIVGFQLCYDKAVNERALTWYSGKGYTHNRVDDGEVPFSNKMSPVLVADGVFEKERIKDLFLDAAGRLEYRIVTLVRDKLEEYPG